MACGITRFLKFLDLILLLTSRHVNAVFEECLSFSPRNCIDCTLAYIKMKARRLVAKLLESASEGHYVFFFVLLFRLC
ncbi:hypothetical protein F4775DRAFT_542324 [Biscogniauxia sp. FL1348]|nr:hypothetical protein F4775DRAFT_542324 [Biscogniauxia sp. FL1348]